MMLVLVSLGMLAATLYLVLSKDDQEVAKEEGMAHPPKETAAVSVNDGYVRERTRHPSLRPSTAPMAVEFQLPTDNLDVNAEDATSSPTTSLAPEGILSPTAPPTVAPAAAPHTAAPTRAPATSKPTDGPTNATTTEMPTNGPTAAPSRAAGTVGPSAGPTTGPAGQALIYPSLAPSDMQSTDSNVTFAVPSAAPSSSQLPTHYSSNATNSTEVTSNGPSTSAAPSNMPTID